MSTTLTLRDEAVSSQKTAATSICLYSSANLVPVFLYGTLMSSQLLAGLLTGDERNVGVVEKRRERAVLHGYSRHAILEAEYPAVIKGTSEDSVDGFLYFPRSLEDIRKLDDHEDESYCRETAEVVASKGQVVEAYVYVWCDELDELAKEDWDFEEFEAKWLR